MLQAASFDGLSFDSGAVGEDGGTAAEVNVGRGQVVEALVIPAVIVVVDERLDLGLQVARQVVVFQRDAVFEGLVPALDLALGLRMVAFPFQARPDTRDRVRSRADAPSRRQLFVVRHRQVLIHKRALHWTPIDHRRPPEEGGGPPGGPTVRQRRNPSRPLPQLQRGYPPG